MSLAWAIPAAILLSTAAGATFFTGFAWLGYLLTLLAGAIVGLAVKSYGPQLVESVVHDGPLETTLGADAAMLGKTWTVFVPGDLPAPFLQLEDMQHLEARSWMARNGAIDASPSLLQLTVVNRSEATVIVRGMSASIEVREILEGNYIYSPSAGDSRSIRVGLDLDEEHPHAKHKDGSPYFSSNSVVLNQNEARVFNISAFTQKSVVQWRLILSLVHRGRNLTMVINGDREPLKTAPSLQGPPDYVWAWFDQPSRLRPEAELHQN